MGQKRNALSASAAAFLAVGLSTSTPAASGNENDAIISSYVSRCVKAAAPDARIRRYPATQPSSDTLFVEDGKPVIELGVTLRYPTYAAGYQNFSQVLNDVALMEESRRRIEQFYGRYGVRLKLTFNHQTVGTNAPPANYHVVYLRRDMGFGMRVIHWGINPTWTADDRGRIHAHETGHLMGLPDEYTSASLRSSRIGESDNLMSDVGWETPAARLYPHQVQMLLSPLCKDVKAQTAVSQLKAQ